MQDRFGSYFPFRRDNRKRDGRWDAPPADRDNIRGTSVDPNEPLWPRWKKTPPLHHEGDFVSDEPFFDIDEITGKAEFYPPGRPLRDGNVGGNPARRQRIDDLPAGNSWRRRLLVGQKDENQYRKNDIDEADAGMQLAFHVPSQPQYPLLSDAQRKEIAERAAKRTDDIGTALGAAGTGLGMMPGTSKGLGIVLDEAGRILGNPAVQQSIGEGTANKAEHDARQRVNDTLYQLLWQEIYKSGGLR